MIVHDHPRPLMANSLLSGDFAAWSLEGLATAKTIAYPQSLHERERPSLRYQKMTYAIGESAIAVAGYRLADLLNHLLDGQ